MIDMTSETVLSLAEATKILPRRRAGKRPHLATLYRWANGGLRGVKLETIQVGGTKCTSREAIQRFCARLSEPHAPPADAPSVAVKRALRVLLARRQAKGT